MYIPCYIVLYLQIPFYAVLNMQSDAAPLCSDAGDDPLTSAINAVNTARGEPTVKPARKKAFTACHRRLTRTPPLLDDPCGTCTGCVAAVGICHSDTL